MRRWLPPRTDLCSLKQCSWEFIGGFRVQSVKGHSVREWNNKANHLTVQRLKVYLGEKQKLKFESSRKLSAHTWLISATNRPRRFRFIAQFLDKDPQSVACFHASDTDVIHVTSTQSIPWRAVRCVQRIQHVAKAWRILILKSSRAKV